MKLFNFAAMLVISLALTGCANTEKPIDQVKNGVKPTKDEAILQINSYLKPRLFDPYSAVVECGDVSDKAWIWRGIGFESDYGYWII